MAKGKKAKQKIEPANAGKIPSPPSQPLPQNGPDPPLPVPPPQTPHRVLATIPEITIQPATSTSKTASTPIASLHTAGQNLSEEPQYWNDTQSATGHVQWEDDGGNSDPTELDNDNIGAGEWGHAGSVHTSAHMNGGDDMTTWGDGSRNAVNAQSPAGVVNGWGPTSNDGGGHTGEASRSGITEWGNPSALPSPQGGESSNVAVRVKSPQPPAPAASPAPAFASAPAPAPPSQPSAPAADPRRLIPRTIQSTRNAFPPDRNTGGKDENWGTPLADGNDWQDDGRYGMAEARPQPVSPASWGVPKRPVAFVNAAPGAWMEWGKEAQKYKNMGRNDPRAPPPAPAPAPAPPPQPAAPQNMGRGGHGHHDLAAQQRNQIQMLRSMLTNGHQGHQKNARWGMPMSASKQAGGHHQRFPAQEQRDGWDTAVNWGGGDPQSSKHANHYMAGHHRPQGQHVQNVDNGWDNPSPADWGGGAGGDWGTQNNDAGWGDATPNAGGKGEVKAGWGAWDDNGEEGDDDGWEDGDEEDDEGYYDEDEGYGDDYSHTKHHDNHRKHEDPYGSWKQSQPQHKHHAYKTTPQRSLHGHTPATATAGLPYDPKLSKTMNLAYGRADAVAATAATVPTMPVTSVTPLRGTVVIDARGAAVQPAGRALYSRKRKAKERIHWTFSANTDARVVVSMKWIEMMESQLATVGLLKFLHDGQRGALFTNAGLRMPGDQPAFDWLTIDDLQHTFDRIMQESILAYNPRLHAVVFVFLLSDSGNSMAIWRKKVPIPEQVRQERREEIDMVMDQLDPKYRIILDEAPPDPPKKKRGFWRRLFGLK